MSKVFVLGLTIGLALISASNASAVRQDQPVEVKNKICPISHEEVGKNGMEPYQMTYKGKVYNLCCPMCVKDFKKNPEKYSAIADQEVSSQK